jgi:hypothetical protein
VAFRAKQKSQKLPGNRSTHKGRNQFDNYRSPGNGHFRTVDNANGERRIIGAGEREARPLPNIYARPIVFS